MLEATVPTGFAVDKAQNDAPIGPVLKLVDGRPMASSLTMAEHFKKRHCDVLRSITQVRHNLPEEFNARNFASVEYTDPKGEKRPVCLMTRDGFTFIVMGFTGKEAVTWKIAYIEAFNAMEAELSRRHAKPDAALAEPSLTPEEASRKTTVEDRKPYKAMVDAWVAAARTNGKFLTHQEAYRIARSAIGGRKAPEMFLGDVPVAIAFVKEKLEQELAAASPMLQGQPQAALPPAQPAPKPDSHARLARLTRNWANTHRMHPVDAMSLQHLVRKVCDATQVYEKVLQEVSQEAMRPFRERTGATPPFDFLMDPLAEMFRNGEDGVRPIYRLYYQALQGVIWVNEIIAICKDKDD